MRTPTWGQGGSWHIFLMGGVIMLLGGSTACSAGTEVPRRAAETSSALEVQIEELLTDATGFALALPGYDLLADTDADVVRIDARTGELESLGDVGAVTSAAALGPESLVVASDTGLWASDGHALVPSPLGDVEGLGGDEAPVLFATPGPEGADLWIGQAGALSLVRDGTLYSLDPDDLDATRPSLAWGAPVGDRAVPWLGSEAGVVALVADGDRLEARRQDLDVDAASLAVDARGSLWVLTDGELARRTADGAWDRMYLDDPITALAGDPGSQGLWAQTETGLWRGLGGVFSPIVDPPAGTLAAVDAAGRAVLVGPEGVSRLSIGRTILMFGLEDGALLEHEAILEVVVGEPIDVTGADGLLDGEPIEVVEGPLRVVLDPLEIADGPHELAVTVHWGDAEASESLYFAVGSFEPPTWSRDVASLFLDHCSECHGPGGAGHRMDTSALWQSQFDDILEMTGSGRMPLPPNPALTPEELQLLRAWRAGGFPE